LHAGFHKTGSTLIQGTLAQTPSLDTVGLGFVPAKVLHGSPFFARFREHRRSRRPSDDVVPQLQSEFAELTTHLGGSRWLLTHEDVLGNPPAGFYRVAARAVRLLRQVVGPRELRFILYIKRQDRMLESIYKQRIQMGRTLDFETFLGEVDVATFSWARVLNDVALEVGEENVVVKLAEDANLGAESFVRDFVSTVIGKPFSGPISIPENTNQSLSAVALECAKRCNELLTPKQQREFRLFLRAQLTGPGFAPAKLLGDDDRARILAMHAKGNREVFERFLKERDPAAYLNP
jgi:hypothetical protein